MQYTDLVHSILNNGFLEEGRNGPTLVRIGETMRFSLEDHKIPLLTTKKVAWKTCLRELLWFIRGQTSNKILKEQGVHIWDANASRSFLDSRNLPHLKEDDLGPVYGHQWRHYNTPYINSDTDYTNQGIDQLAQVIYALQNREQSRRLIICAWNPCQLNEMALPPCHVLAQFHLINGKKLSCSLYQRSGDVGLGVPFNIASYAFLTHLLAHHCDLEAHELIHHIGNAHIYKNHVDALKEQIKREKREIPTIRILNKRAKIEEYECEDVQIDGYDPHPKIYMEMRA